MCYFIQIIEESKSRLERKVSLLVFSNKGIAF